MEKQTSNALFLGSVFAGVAVAALLASPAFAAESLVAEGVHLAEHSLTHASCGVQSALLSLK